MSPGPGRGRSEESPARYEISVGGVLDRSWSPWFEGLAVESDVAGQTVIVGQVADQAALHGLLAKIRDLGLPLVSVRRLGRDPEG